MSGKIDMEAKDYITGHKFSLEPQPEGWWKTVPQPSDMAPYYPAVYYGEGKCRRFPRVVEKIQGWLYGQRVKQVARSFPQGGSVLDVGCGPGHLLAAFRDAGWSPLGTEFSQESAEIPRQNHGLKVIVGPLEELNLGSFSFDAVVSWHTLEHMRDPRASLDHMVRVLRPGGILLVSVPNFGSSEAQACPPAWFHLDVPRHLCHFSGEVLRRQLEERGMVIQRESYFAPEYDSFSLVQTWLNRLGLPHNLLYLVLKGAAKSHQVADIAGSVLLGALLLPLATGWSWWNGVRRKGAVVVIEARKPGASLQLSQERVLSHAA
jgi:SAM-dependent methyltransferase